MKKTHIIIGIGIVILAVVASPAFLIGRRIIAARKPTVVRVEKPQRGELIEFVSAPGEIEPNTNVEISAKVTARIIALPYDEGASVTSGDPCANPARPASVLVRLDSKDLESQLLSAEAGRAAQAAQSEVEKARITGQEADLEGLAASLEQAKRDLERQRGLLQSQDVSQAAFDQAQLKVNEVKAKYNAARHSLEAAGLNLTVLQHNLAAADARIAQARETLSYTTITSPINGVMTKRNAEVGELVITGTMNNPGTVILEVADLSQMLLVAQVDEADVGKLEVGQKATVHVDAFPDREFKGVVQSIALSHTMSLMRTKYYRTEILLENTSQKLYSGLTAHVDIETRKHANVLKLPTQAVLGRELDILPLDIRENSPEVDKSKTFATVVYRCINGKAVATPVKIGQSDLTHTIITSGLTEQDNVIVGPYKVLESIKHDQRIQDEREAEQKKAGRRDKANTDVNKPRT